MFQIYALFEVYSPACREYRVQTVERKDHWMYQSHWSSCGQGQGKPHTLFKGGLSLKIENNYILFKGGLSLKIEKITYSLKVDFHLRSKKITYSFKVDFRSN